MRFSSAIIILGSLAAVQALSESLTPSVLPEFVLDFDEHPSTRYDELFLHYKDELKTMETLFLHSVAPQYREAFKEKEPLFL